MREFKKRLFEILETTTPSEPISKIFAYLMSVLIVLNVLAVILETEETIARPLSYIFNAFEIFSVAVFTIEYLMRLWVCTAKSKYKQPVIGRLRYAITPLAFIDLLAILPFYLAVLLPVDLRFLRALRLFRLLRVFKLVRYAESMRTLGRVLFAKKEQLLVTFFILFVVLIFTSSLMYFVEHEAQPKAFSSIPAAMWWGVATLTTVGYGDVLPVTPLGKFLGAIIMLLGISTFALPAAIISAGFIEEVHKKKAALICPHCGNDIKFD